MHMIRKEQARWVSGSAVRRQIPVHQQAVRVGFMRRRSVDRPIALLLVFESCSTSTGGVGGAVLCSGRGGLIQRIRSPVSLVRFEDILHARDSTKD